MSQPNNNGHEKKKPLVVIDPTSLPKSTSLTWDYYRCNIDTDNLQTDGVLQVPIGTDIDRVRSSAMHAHAKVANDLQIEFDPFNATITISKITLPLQDD
jgi:hypothetical protein